MVLSRARAVLRVCHLQELVDRLRRRADPSHGFEPTLLAHFALWPQDPNRSCRGLHKRAIGPGRGPTQRMGQMRKLKVIGLAAFAILAVSAVTASAANAAEGSAVVSAGETEFTANQPELSPHTFTLTGGRQLTCSVARFTGKVKNGDTTIHATPHYTECHVKVGSELLPATVNMGSCTYTFTDLTTTASMTYAAKTELTCPTGDVSIRVYKTAVTHAAGTILCEYTIKGQSGLTGVHFTDNTNGTINIKATSVAVSTTRVMGLNSNCGEAGPFNSIYNGDTLAVPAAGTLGITD